MIKAYKNGQTLLDEHRSLLDEDKFLSVFFRLDAPGITDPDSRNYALCAEQDGQVLLAVKLQPWSLLLYGSPAPADELTDYITTHSLEIGGIMGSEAVCERVTARLRDRLGQDWHESLAMDFMEAHSKTEPSSPDVEIPTDADVDELAALTARFISDCGLADEVDVDGIRATVGNYRVIRAGGRIMSMAKAAPSSDTDKRIASVYTRPEGRGQKYARRVVNTLKNEILDTGRIATLTVDRHNPVSNHLYESLGFVRTSSMGEYRQKEARKGMNLKLVRLTPALRPQLIDMMSEWLSVEQDFSPRAIRKNDYRDFERYLAELDCKEERDGHVPSTVFFCLDVDRNIFVGAVDIRHYLNESLLFTGGHIGDGVRPSERRKGVATDMIGLALEECRRMGIDRVLMTCDKDNIGSAKSIIRNGGVLENEVINEEGVPEQRYWIRL